MQTGTVSFFMNDRGYGFIQPDHGSAEIFVHVSALQRAGIASLDRDQRVEALT